MNCICRRTPNHSVRVIFDSNGRSVTVQDIKPHQGVCIDPQVFVGRTFISRSIMKGYIREEMRKVPGVLRPVW